MNRNFKVEKDFVIDEFRCVIIGQRMGHRCGYIEIPQDHKYYGVHYEALNCDDVDVHGGWTYSSSTTENNYPVKTNKDSWWVGFDCAHYMDARDLDLIKSFGDDKLTRMYVEMEEDSLFRSGEVRTIEYVENELINAVKQLKMAI